MSGTGNFQYNAPTNFRIGQTAPDDVPPEYRTAFTQLYNSIQQIISTLVDNCGIGPRNIGQWPQLVGYPYTVLSGNLNRLYARATAAIPFGAAVHFIPASSGSAVEAEQANATDHSKPCRGFCTTSGGIALGEVGEFQIQSGLIPVTGLTPGASYYLATADGQISPSPAVGAGNIEQYVGFAVTNSHLAFNVGAWLQH